MTNSASPIAQAGPASFARWLSRQIGNAYEAGNVVARALGTGVEPKRFREMRGAARRRTYLCRGKVTDLANRLIAECQIRDRSETGARIRLATDTALPPGIRLFDDTLLSIETGEVVWRRGREVGIRFRRELDSKLKQTYRTSRSGKVYSVKR